MAGGPRAPDPGNPVPVPGAGPLAPGKFDPPPGKPPGEVGPTAPDCPGLNILGSIILLPASLQSDGMVQEVAVCG